MPIARTMQLLGYALFAIAGLEPAFSVSGSVMSHRVWLTAYLLFGVAFHFGASVPAGPKDRPRRGVALALMVPALLAMAWDLPCSFGALLLFLVASQSALILSPKAAVGLALGLTAAIGHFLYCEFGFYASVSDTIALLGFQLFAVAAIATARREFDARMSLARTHEELLATRSLLDEATRREERTRIARDLHDVLGHNLTALGLQLEIASHVPEAAARVQVAKARELTSRLLGEVRDVVSAMQTPHSPCLVAALRALVVEVPGLTVHMDVPESLVVEDASRAECLIRCVQEIVTNTRKHAEATNLWVVIRQVADELFVQAHDDGKGARELRDGNGLRGMRSRLEQMGGRLDVRTAHERAFAIDACLPLRPLSALAAAQS